MAVARRVDVNELDQRKIRRIVDLTCRQCGARFEYAQMWPGGLPLRCADCAAEHQRQRARHKEQRKLQRRLESLWWMHKRELADHVAGQGHEPLTVYRCMTCMRCRQLLARRRGPASSTAWFVEQAAEEPCWDVRE